MLCPGCKCHYSLGLTLLKGVSCVQIMSRHRVVRALSGEGLQFLSWRYAQLRTPAVHRRLRRRVARRWRTSWWTGVRETAWQCGQPLRRRSASWAGRPSLTSMTCAATSGSGPLCTPRATSLEALSEGNFPPQTRNMFFPYVEETRGPGVHWCELDGWIRGRGPMLYTLKWHRLAMAKRWARVGDGLQHSYF